MSPSQAHCIAMKPSSAAGDGFLYPHRQCGFSGFMPKRMTV